MSLIGKIHNLLFKDKGAIFIIINKMATMLKGPISMFFIVTYLSKEQQGIWYSFASLGALSIFAELGFTRIITQYISCEYAHLKMENGVLCGVEENKDRLFSLVRFSLKMYFVIVPLAVVILCFFGLNFFSNEILEVRIAWIVFSFINGFGLIWSLLQAMYMGLNAVELIQKNILIGSFASSITSWISLFFGLNIWALILGGSISILGMMIILYVKTSVFWKQFLNYRISKDYGWGKELLKLQGRYAISCISGYFIFCLYVPVVYKIYGSEMAGKLGITIAIVTAIKEISLSFSGANMPKYSILFSLGKYSELNLLYRETIKKGAYIYILLSVIFLIGILVMEQLGILSGRFLNIKLCVLLIVLEAAHYTISSMANFTRAFKEDIFWRLFVLCGLFIGFSLLFLLPILGLDYLLGMIAFVYWFIVMPVFFYIKKIFMERVL